jgi:polyisoprenoid-binding protein YceI
MKPIKKILLSAIAILSISATTLVESKYVLSKNYTVTILGTSNLHNWNETVETVSGDGSVTWNEDGSFNLDAINLKMEVHSIKSDMGSIMNNNTYKALKADKNPEIIFTLTTPINSVKAGSETAIISAKGTLTIAGITKPIDMNVKVSIKDHTLLSFEGSQTIKMTDYGISPPTALFGTLKTGDGITISFKTSFTITPN